MFTKIVLGKGTRIGHSGQEVCLLDEQGATVEPLADAQAALFASIFPPGVYHFPNGLEVPKLRSIKIDVRLGVVTVR